MWTYSTLGLWCLLLWSLSLLIFKYYLKSLWCHKIHVTLFLLDKMFNGCKTLGIVHSKKCSWKMLHIALSFVWSCLSFSIVRWQKVHIANIIGRLFISYGWWAILKRWRIYELERPFSIGGKIYSWSRFLMFCFFAGPHPSSHGERKVDKWELQERHQLTS